MNNIDLRQLINTYSSPSPYKSTCEITITMSLMILTYIGFYIYLHRYPQLIFLMSFPAGLLLVRVFIIQHDAGHNTLFYNNKYNHAVGLVCSLFTLTPYLFWRQAHAIHHRNSSNIDKRGIGDIDFKTISEYKILSKWQKIKYTVMRHPLFLIGCGGFIYFIIQNRYFNYDSCFRSLFSKKSIQSIYLTNIACALLYASIIYYTGSLFFLIVLLPVFWVSSCVGSYLFYVQHNFDDVYFGKVHEFTDEPKLKGSSFLKLPFVLRWITGNIGYHHIHHLCPKMPFYNLMKSHKKLIDTFYIDKVISEYSLFNSMHLFKLKLYDEENKKMICWDEYTKHR